MPLRRLHSSEARSVDVLGWVWQTLCFLFVTQILHQ